jgi:hypothetical protein
VVRGGSSVRPPNSLINRHNSTIRDLPIALPRLTGAHTGERIAEVVGNRTDTFVTVLSETGCSG